jgi:hypothetical protein
MDKIVYSTSNCNNSPFYTERDDAPEIGGVFTARVIKEREKEDLVLKEHNNYTGYIKHNNEDSLRICPGGYYRFKVVAGPFKRKNHNYYYAIPLRRIRDSKNLNRNQINPSDYIMIQRLAEFLLGIRFNRDKTISSLRKNQRNWKWFYRNFLG